MSKPLNAAMDNVHAWRLGELCNKAAADPKVGDYIDRGLILLKALNDAGYDVVVRDGSQPGEAGNG